MLGLINEFEEYAAELDMKLVGAETTQVLSEEELINLLPDFDGWIIGDDPATRRVLEAGKYGQLRAAVKWGIGIDNVDFEACHELDIPITNTPKQFGEEVADLAIAYLLALARHTYQIHDGVKHGGWPKPRGTSLRGKVVGIVGLGDIGYSIAYRLERFGVQLIGYDPFIDSNLGIETMERVDWPQDIENIDFLIFACALTDSNKQMLDSRVLNKTKRGIRIINVSRGPLIDETALIDAILGNKVIGAALDVFEVEPLPLSSALRDFDNVIFGSHNGSNTEEAVRRASNEALKLLGEFLND